MYYILEILSLEGFCEEQAQLQDGESWDGA